MDIEMLQSIYAHASWANEKLFAAAAGLPAAQLAQRAANTDSIMDLLVHLVDVQRTWLARDQGTSVPALDPTTCSTLVALRELWQSTDHASRTYIAELHAGELAAIVHYTNAKGQPQAYPRWQILLHQALHAAQHRSEAALLLTALGHSTGWLDYLIYIDEMREV